ncbi:helix-turn-helix transcriptional regulator [Dysgonomonas sp. 25]|uniref:helix-turn-helix domain-containing protein n=1 Tax=Dysgonomonas sp. 25 TaxID=2302933 RepID=UPI0013D23ECC|nr:helix-turn-helix transcriptional regulator [Dysgonomonas sp. 25]NDV68555.1 XRE family transcriptional regulator [Dysgonomonas sp. 25]
MSKETIDYETFDFKRIKQHRKFLGITQDELAEWLNAGRTTIIRYEKGRIPIEAMPKITRFLDVKTKEELYGVLVDDFGLEYKTLSNGEYQISIPYIPISSYQQYANTFELGDLQLGYVVDNINTGLYVAFEVKGEAMDNGSRRSLTKGDIAIAKELDKDNLQMDEINGEIWVVILEGDILFRKVEKFVRKDNKIVFRALNPSKEYADFSLNLAEIKKLYRVIERRTNF